MSRCRAARHSSGIHTLNDKMLWQAFQENCKLRREKKERESKEYQTKKQAYIQARPRDLSCDQHVIRHTYCGFCNLLPPV